MSSTGEENRESDENADKQEYESEPEEREIIKIVELSDGILRCLSAVYIVSYQSHLLPSGPQHTAQMDEYIVSARAEQEEDQSLSHHHRTSSTGRKGPNPYLELGTSTFTKPKRYKWLFRASSLWVEHRAAALQNTFISEVIKEI